MEGWIKLHRELMDKPIWKCSTPEQKVILVTILMMANHDQKEWEWKGKKFICKPGQMITSLPSIVAASGLGISIQNVRTALKRFENYEFLTDESTSQNRLITISNWDTYQILETEDNRQSNRRLTDDQQTPNRRLTANKNDNNERMKEDIIYSASGTDTGHIQPDFILTKKKRKLSGKRLETFLVFWEKFNYKKGKAEAADSWIDIPQLTNSICEQIFKAAEIEDSKRVKLIEKGSTPKMAQGWITARRWEDEDLQPIQKSKNEKLNRPIYDPELR